jgi:hypothetical protein
MQGLDATYYLTIGVGWMLIFSGHTVHAGVAGSAKGTPQYRVHVYFGGKRKANATYPIDFMGTHLPSFVRRFTLASGSDSSSGHRENGSSGGSSNDDSSAHKQVDGSSAGSSNDDSSAHKQVAAHRPSVVERLAKRRRLADAHEAAAAAAAQAGA